MAVHREMKPCGLIWTASPAEHTLDAVPIDQLQRYIEGHRLVLLRGFDAPSADDMLMFCGKLGGIHRWEFGAINELEPAADPQDYLYTHEGVPFHWDGAFVEQPPRYIFFHCQTAPPPGCGGETLFCDTIRLLQHTSEEERARWTRIMITYNTPRGVYRGGAPVQSLLDEHPVTGEIVVRYAEPVDDFNPVTLEIQGLPEDEHEPLQQRMRELLYDPNYCLSHEWQGGDLVVADNHALLHGRNAFRQSVPRQLQRINIL